MKGPFAQVLLILVLLVEASWAGSSVCKTISSGVERPHSVSITEFGAVGDGVTVNTKAFTNAIFYLSSFADKGGAQLFVPAGRWLTGSFVLISHLTLLLDKDAVILGSMNSDDWPVIDHLPSFGRGRELPGGRHRSLIHGSNLTDVVITGIKSLYFYSIGRWTAGRFREPDFTSFKVDHTILSFKFLKRVLTFRWTLIILIILWSNLVIKFADASISADPSITSTLIISSPTIIIVISLLLLLYYYSSF